MSEHPLATDFSRERLAGYDPAVLSGAKVALIGAGALGQNAALCLALSGVGSLAIVDLDTFEPSNRTRSPFFVADAPKAPAVASAWLDLATAANPAAFAYAGRVEEVGDLVVDWADVVLAAVDKRSARAYLAAITRRHRRPLVEAGFHALDLSLAVFSNATADEPCWRCGRRDVADVAARSLCSLYAARVEEQGAVPAVQAVAQVCGGLAAEAVIAFLHGSSPLTGRRMSLHLRSGRSVVAELPLDGGCLGDHRPLDARPMRVATPASASLGDLLSELESLGAEPEVALPSPFVATLGCRRCGGAVAVGPPLYGVTEAPVCPGGCRSGRVKNAFAAAPFAIANRSSSALLDRPCTELGLGPGTIAEVAFADGSAAWVRMPGDLPSVFTSVRRSTGRASGQVHPRPDRGHRCTSAS